MAFSSPLVQAGVCGLEGLFRRGEATPSQVCAVYLDRIGRFDASIGAFAVIDAEGATAAAAASDLRWAAGRALSPLDGCPVGVKVNIAVQGLPWHAGIAAYRDRLAAADADCVARLRAAGAVILGLLHMDEGAFGATGDNPAFGRIHNPWRAGHTAGGSSSGSGAATAAGMCAAALGTDTLGSVRIPAAMCGVFGHKPSRGAVSTRGVVALSPTLDHVGVLARSVDDCAAILRIAREDRLARVGETGDLVPGRIAAMRGDEGLDPAVAHAFEAAVDAARAAGLHVDRIDLGPASIETRRAAVLVMAAEGMAEHGAQLAADPDGFSPGLLQRLGLAGRRSADDLGEARRTLDRSAEAVRDALGGYAALLTPTTPRPSPGFPDEMVDSGLFTALANVAALPATAFPLGVSPDGLPLSVQAISFDDVTGLGLARLLARSPGTPPGFA